MENYLEQGLEQGMIFGTARMLLGLPGIDIDKKDAYGITLLYKLCGCWGPNNIPYSDNRDITFFMMENGADPTQGDVFHWLISCFLLSYQT
jgi:hypothetical protein